MCQWGANRNPWAGYRMDSSLILHVRRNPPHRGGGQKVPIWNCSHIGDHRLSTSCGFVERPDHHCGDDLVLRVSEKPKRGHRDEQMHSYCVTHGIVICIDYPWGQLTITNSRDGWASLDQSDSRFCCDCCSSTFVVCVVGFDAFIFVVFLGFSSQTHQVQERAC